MGTFDFIQTYGMCNFGTNTSKKNHSIYFYEASVIWESDVVWPVIEISFSSDEPTMVYFYSEPPTFGIGSVVNKSLSLFDCYMKYSNCYGK